MTNDRDPVLQALFDAAPQAPRSYAFVEQVMADIDRQRRRTIAGWIVAAILLVPFAWWLSGPVVSTLNVATQLMPESLITIESGLLEQVLAPINSVAGAAGLLFFGVWWFYRKVFA